MKPQPMSDAEIDEVWGDELGYDAKRSEHAAIQRLIAARDAQWAAMIGEPVAWSYVNSKGWKMADFSGPHDLFKSSPLYAIKETP